MQTSLKNIHKRALSHKTHRFGGLYSLLTVSNLRWAFYQLNKKAATGVDNVSFCDYEKDLERNLESLVLRLKNKTYKAKLIRRKMIPKSPGKMRPLGIPALEDKIVQCAVSKILGEIYEADFIDNSYGYRPCKGAKDAVSKLSRLASHDSYHYVVEADIKGFFDNINHDLLLKMIERRVDDRAFIGLIRKWLKAGILIEDKVIHPETGTPQGGIISPILANIYLHYCLDMWVVGRVRQKAYGNVELIRYADDFVVLFERKIDADAFYRDLKTRLGRFNLEVAEEKTKLLCFSRFGNNDNGRFEFLGFEFSWGLSRTGKPIVKRRTARVKLRAGIKRFQEWIKKSRSRGVSSILRTVSSKFTGHYNYYGVIGNCKSLNQYYHVCRRLLFKWLNRRSQRRSYNWTGFDQVLKMYQIPVSKITERKTKEDKQPMLPFF